MIASRRTLLKYMSTAPIAIGALTPAFPGLFEPAMASVTPTARLGVITENDPSGYLNFANWFQRKPNLAHLYFNQTSASALSSSISYICRQAAAFIADGAQILWSVPCPGAGQLEAINAGSYNSLYTNLFQSILAVTPSGSAPIFVRLPWEFNLSGQTNAAKDKHGNWNAELFRGAWRILANLCRAVSSRFQIIWCPNVCTQGIDPETCYPGGAYVDIIAQDFYMQSAYDKAGFFKAWYLTAPNGLAWGAAFAASKGRPYALSEWGMDSDIFAGDLTAAATWLKALPNVHHHCWWDRPEVIDCRISNGMHPGLAAAYKSKFS